MAKVWQITGKKGLSGHRVSHANYKTHHIHQPNLKKKRVFVPEPDGLRAAPLLAEQPFEHIDGTYGPAPLCRARH